MPGRAGVYKKNPKRKLLVGRRGSGWDRRRHAGLSRGNQHSGPGENSDARDAADDVQPQVEADSDAELSSDLDLSDASSDSDSEPQPSPAPEQPEQREQREGTAPRRRKAKKQSVPSIVKGRRGASRAAKRLDDGRPRQTVSRNIAATRARKLAEAARLIYGLDPGDPLPEQAIQGLQRHNLLPLGTSVGTSLAEALAVDHVLRPPKSRSRRLSRTVAAATGKTKQTYVAGGNSTSSPAKRVEKRRLDGIHNPTPKFFLPGGCGHAGCTEEHCGYGARCDPADILQRYCNIHTKPEWWHPSTPVSDRCVFVRQCDDGMDAKRRKSTWSAQTSTFSVMNEPNCVSVAHTLVHCIAQCKETKSEMDPVLESTSTQMAQLASLSCSGTAMPVKQFIGQDLKAEAIQDHLSLSKTAGQFCEFCRCDHEFRHYWREDLVGMRASARKSQIAANLDKPRSVDYAVAAAARVAAFADTVEIYRAVMAHCKPRKKFESQRLMAALRARQLQPADSQDAQIKQLVAALRQEGPAAGGPAPAWKRREKPWVKVSDKDSIYDDIVAFARNNHNKIEAILAVHTGSSEHTHGHLGPPCSPHIPWEHRCPGVFHTSLHHRNQLFKLFAELAHACGDECLMKFAKALVQIGLDDYAATEAMEKLEVPRRQGSTKDAFDGPDSIVFMFMMPRLIATVFDFEDPNEKRCAEQLGKGRKLIRDVHRLMLCTDWQAQGIDNGPTQLRAAAYALCKWLRDLTARNTHTDVQPSKLGMAYYNSAFHNLMHICDMAILLWDQGRISIGRFSEQGNEAMNKKLLFELRDRCNNKRIVDLKQNMFVLALQNIWRDNFQYLTKPMKKQKTCQACKRCAAGKGCGRNQSPRKRP
eukprot:COSAG02_NODE_7427_length_3020_cov_1.982198_1_plen_868_part_10